MPRGDIAPKRVARLRLMLRGMVAPAMSTASLPGVLP